MHEHDRGFWEQLPRPFYVMAPMADVTDAAFRLLIARRGKPGVFMTEFVSCDGLCSRGLTALMKHLWFDPVERPIVVQFFGENPETFYQSAQLAQELGFDGIDINMGCPVRTVTKTGSGAALIKTPELAQEIVRATKAGAGSLPVSVKTRIGYNKVTLNEWVSALLEVSPAALTLHLRTAKEQSLVDAHWELMPQAVELCKGTQTLLIGNGDVRSLDHADELAARYGVDGLMLGRAIYGNPWLFARRDPQTITLDEKYAAMREHAHLFQNVFRGEKNFAMMRKHLRAHASGFPGARELRVALETIESATDVEEILAAAERRVVEISEDDQHAARDAGLQWADSPCA